MSEPNIATSIKVALKPWDAPNFATRADGDPTAGGIPVRDLNDDALEDMALAWLRALYAKAGRSHCPFYKPAKAMSNIP